MAEYRLTTPLKDEDIKKLRAGDSVKLSGIIYTARDAAHARLVTLIGEGKKLPFDLEGQIIYYVGPSPAKPGNVIGSAGPTTSYRMDSFAPILLKNGLKGMIGKGQRNQDVKDAIVKFDGVYFGAVGGAAALIAKSIKESEVIAYEDLGTEAIRRLVVEDFPVIVVNTPEGDDLYTLGKEKYRIK